MKETEEQGTTPGILTSRAVEKTRAKLFTKLSREKLMKSLAWPSQLVTSDSSSNILVRDILESLLIL